MEAFGITALGFLVIIFGLALYHMARTLGALDSMLFAGTVLVLIGPPSAYAAMSIAVPPAPFALGAAAAGTLSLAEGFLAAGLVQGKPGRAPVAVAMGMFGVPLAYTIVNMALG